MHSTEESAAIYLQQIQPRNLADLIVHVQHDLLMLVGSYTSYRDLFEQQIPTLDLPFNLQSDIEEIFTIISKATQGLKSAINTLPDFSALPIIDVQLASERRHLVAYDLISGSGNLLECSRLLQHLLDGNAASMLANQRASELNRAMLLTAERMLVLIRACRKFSIVSIE